MDVPWGTGHVSMVNSTEYPSIAAYIAAQDWHSEPLDLFYQAPRRSGVYLAQDFYCYKPQVTVEEVPELPALCHGYECMRGVSFYTDYETECSFITERESYQFNGDVVCVPSVITPVTLYQGHNIIVWCDSDFPVSVDWTCIRGYRENCGASFGNRGWSRWDFYLCCPSRVVRGEPLPPWTVRQIPEDIIGRSSGAYRVYRESIIPQTGLAVLVWPPRREQRPPSLGIMSRICCDANHLHEEKGKYDLSTVAGDFRIQVIRKKSRVLVMFDPLPAHSDEEEDESIYYS